MVAKDRAMELHHVFRAGLLVEAVDVLGNDVDWARVMGDRPMSRVRLGLVMDEEVPIEIEEGRGILVQLVDRKEPFIGETVPTGHPADARLAPKVGNSRGRRHPSPIQEGQGWVGLHLFLQKGQCFFPGKHALILALPPSVGANEKAARRLPLSIRSGSIPDAGLENVLEALLERQCHFLRGRAPILFDPVAEKIDFGSK